MDVTYNPGIFEPSDMAAARKIILTKEGELSTDARWERETPYTADLLGEALDLKTGQIVVDYGCGVGRLAKALIERFDCRVLGIDTSQSMRAMAPEYVQSASFSAISCTMLQGLSQAGFRADAAISAWVLQHCLKPAVDIRLIREALKDGGRLGVLNNEGRAVPTVERGWVNDGLDIRALLAERFVLQQDGRLDRQVAGDMVADNTFWAIYA